MKRKFSNFSTHKLCPILNYQNKGLPMADKPRINIYLSDEDWGKVLRLREDGDTCTVTDLHTKIRFKHTPVACSLPECFCDSVVVPVIPKADQQFDAGEQAALVEWGIAFAQADDEDNH